MRTGATVVWTFIVASVVWIRLASFYNDGLAAAANLVLPGDVWLEAFPRSLRIQHAWGSETYRESINSLVLHSGLLIVVALVAGTPWRSLRWRFLASGYVAASFFVLQSLGLAVFAIMLKRSLSGSVSIDNVSIGLAIFWALTPLIVGGAWAYRFWLPAFRPAPVSTGRP